MGNPSDLIRKAETTGAYKKRAEKIANDLAQLIDNLTDKKGKPLDRNQKSAIDNLNKAHNVILFAATKLGRA